PPHVTPPHVTPPHVTPPHLCAHHACAPTCGRHDSCPMSDNVAGMTLAKVQCPAMWLAARAAAPAPLAQPSTGSSALVLGTSGEAITAAIQASHSVILDIMRARDTNGHVTGV